MLVFLFRVIRKLGFYVNQEKHEKYIIKHLGIKWQLEVKHIPTNCYSRKNN